MANAGVVAQNLTTVAHNPKNLCSGNAVIRCWSWLSGFMPDPTMIWGHLHQAFRRFLGSSQPCHLPDLKLDNKPMQQSSSGSSGPLRLLLASVVVSSMFVTLQSWRNGSRCP